MAFNRVLTHTKAPMMSPDIAIFTRPFILAITHFLLVEKLNVVSCATSELEISRRDPWHPPYRNEDESGPRSFLRKSFRQR